MTKIDRRKQYTRMVLKDSLMSLLKEKPISAITVKELCEVADINRSTYYAHYTDAYDLLYKIEEEFIEDMIETLMKFNFVKEEEEALRMTEKIIEYISANKDICQTLLSDHGDPNFQKRLMNITQQFAMNSWIKNASLDEQTSKYFSLFVVSGSFHMIKNWLENNIDLSPKEMAEMINQFSNKGLQAFM